MFASSFIFQLILVILCQHFNFIKTILASNNVNINYDQQNNLKINTIGSRLGDHAILPCGVNIKEILPHDKNGLLTVPVLVNWFRHYSLTRKSDRPIFTKYLAHLIDYDPHIEREYENRLQIVDQINLNISSLKTTDEGIYECKLIFFDKAYADYQNGSLAYLQIYVAPEFENLSEEIYYLKPHMPIRLYCYARGKPTPAITWYKNGKKLNNNSSTLYEAPHENYDFDLIEYKCAAENIIDRIEYNIKVIKYGSLIFSEPLQNQTVVEGMLLNWPCLAQSNVDISYKWFKDSIAVQTYLRKWPDRGAVFQDGMLYLSETLRDDSGFYECHAYTQSRRIQSRAYLNVIYPPEIVDFDPIAYALEGSQTLTLDCSTKSNPPVHSYEWFKDGQIISNNNKYIINSNGSLVIKHIKKLDAGEYHCSAQNTLKKAFSIKMKLNIVPNKKIDSILYASSSQAVYKIPCKHSHLVTKWFKVGSKMPKGRYSIDSNGQLNLLNLNKIDTGLYLCIHEQNEEQPDEKFLNEQQKLTRLIIVENATIKNPEVEMKNSRNFPIEAKNELPLPPENIKVNQTFLTNEILITWSYPEQTKIKIEYYQLNYRHYNNKSQEIYSDWITIEPISVSDTSYSLNTNDLIENEFYQIQMISYSIYSHSSPTELVTFKFVDENKDIESKLQDPNLQLISPISSNTATLLKSVSQLDVILVTVFLFLIFILAICVLACIVYYRSNRYTQQRKNIDSKDLDDWGFQSSSGGVTATFLSSSPSPSSEKSSQLLTDNKTCPTLNRNMKNANYKEDINSDSDENREQNSPNEICQQNIIESINSESSSSSNSTTILSTNTNSTNLTHKNLMYQRPSLIRINNEIVYNNNATDESDYANWVNTKNNIDTVNKYSTSSINTIQQHQPFKQNFAVSIKNINGSSLTIKRPVVQYPFKTIQQEDYSTIKQIDAFNKIQSKYNSLKVDYV